MTILGRFTKQPAEKESYSIEFEDDLVDADAVASATAVVEPVGLKLESTLVIGTRVKILVSGGGSVGTRHKITVTATTDDGRILQDEFYVVIKEY